MEKNKSLKEIVIKIEGEKWENALDKAFKKANANAKIPGFRPGKAPKNVYLKNYGIESLFMDASNYAVEDAYNQMLEENKNLEIAAQPVLDIRSIDEKYIEYVFTITLKPEVKLGKYKGLNVKKEAVKVSKKEIEEAVDHMREHYKENVVKEGAVENGDIAIIDFEGFKDGVAFDGGKGENYSLEIGSNTFIPGFEDQIVGMKAGEEKDINVSFPEDYHAEDLKGAPVVFKVKVNEVKEVKVPDLDKEFFEDLGMEGIDSKEALEKQVKENITASKEAKAEDKYTEDLLAEIAKTTEVDVPETMINDETERMVDHFAEHIMMQGISIDQFYQYTNSSREALKEQYKEEAEKRIKYRLILEEIIKTEKIKVTDKEVEEKVEELAQKYNMTKEEVKKQYGENLDYIKYDLEVTKAFDAIKGDK
ncbi:MAG: trigger factor [Firmicutes bacterium]|nr:trigger factor [Bacillota bacterium]